MSSPSPRLKSGDGVDTSSKIISKSTSRDNVYNIKNVDIKFMKDKLINLSEIEAANTLISMLDNSNNLNSVNDPIFLSQFDINENVNKEIKNIVEQGFYKSPIGEKKYITPKVNIISNTLIKNNQGKDNSDIEMYYNPELKQDEVKNFPNSEQNRSNLNTSINKKDKEHKVYIVKYDLYDGGPFIVFIESTNNLLKYQQLGRILCNHPEMGVIKITKKGFNKAAIYFNSFRKANSFLEDQKFLENSHIKAYIPKSAISVKGLLRGVDTSFSEEEILENISPINNSKKIFEIRRIKKRVIEKGETLLVNTPLIVFSIKGRTLPEKIALFKCIIDTEKYIQPVVQCFSCLRYGHTASQCKGKPKCKRCGSEDNGGVCNKSCHNHCIHCKSNEHNSLQSGVEFKFRNCKEFLRQKSIKIIMSDKNINYKEAEKLVNLEANIEDTNNYKQLEAPDEYKHINNLTFPPLGTEVEVEKNRTIKKNFTFSKIIQKKPNIPIKRTNFHNNDNLISPNGRNQNIPNKKPCIHNPKPQTSNSYKSDTEEEFSDNFFKI